MKFTVLGKSPAWQDAGGACSGYLVTEDATAILLDCGNGVFGKLRQFHDYVDVGAVFISHLHADHYLDLFPFAFALLLAPRQQPVPVDRWPGTDSPARPLLYLPPGGYDLLRQAAGIIGLPSLIEDAFEVREYDPESRIEHGSLAATFRQVPHYTETWAIDVTDPAGSRVTYGSDCRPNRELVDFARGTDLLVAEATLPRPERSGERGHMTPAEAGEHAAASSAGRLVLTHISDELDPEWAVAEARGHYGGSVEVAREGMEIDL
ncbi:MAG: MBL fold metallo-hydrolase [Thermoleophilia bacterium]|nr:MBL fold metallo-hydrolase [Thermoleophilia bacterium]